MFVNYCYIHVYVHVSHYIDKYMYNLDMVTPGNINTAQNLAKVCELKIPYTHTPSEMLYHIT